MLIYAATADEQGKTFTLPIKKKKFSSPVTHTQRLVHDCHHQHLMQGYQSYFASKVAHDPIEEEEGKFRLQQSIDLINNLNLAYVAPVYFGTPLQQTKEAEFVYDTGSGYLTTTSTSCSSCGTAYYDPSKSETADVVSSATKQLDYGSASLTGYMGSDQVCLSEDMCVQGFDFFVITNQSGLTDYDGILGLSPPDESQNGPSYMKQLYKQGVIDKEVATFWLNYYGDADSYVTFGGKPENSSIGETFTQNLVRRYD